jgi:hypothetical protein
MSCVAITHEGRLDQASIGGVVSDRPGGVNGAVRRIDIHRSPL